MSSRPVPSNKFLARNPVITLYGQNDKCDAASVSHEEVCGCVCMHRFLLCHLDLTEHMWFISQYALHDWTMCCYGRYMEGVSPHLLHSLFGWKSGRLVKSTLAKRDHLHCREKCLVDAGC